MKLHLPKGLFIAVLAAISSILPTTSGADTISVNFTGSETTKVTNSSSGSLGGVGYEGWNNVACTVGQSELKDNKGNQQAATLVLGYDKGNTAWDGMGSYRSATDPNGTVTGDVQRGYIDVWNTGENHYTISLTHDYWLYDAIFYMSGDTAGATFAPMEVNGTAYIGGTDVLATDANKAWGSGYTTGCTEYTDNNRITVTKLSGTLLATNAWNNAGSRATLAGLQVVDRTAETVYFTTLGSGETTTANASWSLNGAAATPYADISAEAKYLGVVADAAGSTLKVTAEDTIKFLGLKENTLTVASDGSITVTNILADAGSTLNITAGLNSSSMNLCGGGNISISGDLKLDNDANPRNTLVSMAKNVSISGSLYSKGGVITLGDGINRGMMTVGRVEMGDVSSGTGSILNLENGYILKVTGSTNAQHENNLGWGDSQYKHNSFTVSEWGVKSTLNIKGTILAKDAAILSGDKGATINIENGGTVATKGIGRSATSKTDAYAINLKEGGKLVLGDMGIDCVTNSTVNVTGGTEGAFIGIAADEVTIKDPLNVTGKLIVNTAQHSYTETGVQLAADAKGGKLTIESVISSTGSLSKEGAGELVLTGDNTYSGGTTVNKGELVADSGAALGTGSVTVNGGSVQITEGGGAVTVEKLDGSTTAATIQKSVSYTHDSGNSISFLNAKVTFNAAEALSVSNILKEGSALINEGSGTVTVLNGWNNMSRVEANKGDINIQWQNYQGNMKALVVGEGRTVGAHKGKEVAIDNTDSSYKGTFTLTESASFGKDSKLYANLTLETGAEVTMAGELYMGESTLSLKEGLTLKLTGDLLGKFEKYTPGSEPLVLITGVNTLKMGDQTYTVGSQVLTEAKSVSLSDYITIEGFEQYYVSFNSEGSVIAGLSVPEPTTTTLGLLALAGLCARRRRK